jgi:hypothetical protein
MSEQPQTYNAKPYNPQPPTRTSAEIDDRIARLAIRWHYEEDPYICAELMSAAAALYWVSDPTCTPAEALDRVDNYMTEVLKEEGLTP